MLEAGGLFILGTERHESRRIDNQLRGRSGRQGDPGASKFYLSLEDDLMRIFGSGRIDGMLQRLGLKEGEAIIHPWVNKALEKAQQKVEARNFEIRKNLLKFDDVMNDQRKVVYEQRKELMHADDVAQTVADMRHHVVEALVARHVPANAYAEQWNMHGLHAEVLRIFNLDLPLTEWAAEEGIADEEIRTRLLDITDRKMAEKAANYGADVMRMVEKSLLLQILDQVWKEHLLSLDHLRQGIGLRAYGQRDPLNEYKREAFALFEAMLERLRERVIAGAGAHRVAGRSRARSRHCSRRRGKCTRRARTRRSPRRKRHRGRSMAAMRRKPPRPFALVRARRRWIRAIRRLGAVSPAMPRARAAPARSTSTATAVWPDQRSPVSPAGRPSRHSAQSSRFSRVRRRDGRKPSLVCLAAEPRRSRAIGVRMRIDLGGYAI